MKKPNLPAGKLPTGLLREILHQYRGASADVLLPPTVGEDAGVIGIGGGALVVATDPITLTGREVGAHAVMVNANDVAAMGVRPRWFLAAVLLPVGATESDVTEIFHSMKSALDRLDITLVGGHTEITPAVVQPVVVGQMMGFQEDGKFLRTGGARSGDAILQIGPAPIEGAAVLANEAADLLGEVAPEVLARARGALETPGISVVGPALRAAALGATALHDPTEGGLSAGLHELAEASELALRVDLDAALWFAPGKTLCEALGADPWGVLASGALLAAFPEDLADEAKGILVAEGYATAVLARAESGKGVHTSDGSAFRRYEQDEVSRILAEQQG